MVDEQTKPATVTTASLLSLVKKSEQFVQETLLDIGRGKLEARWVDPAHVGMGIFTVEVPSVEDEDVKRTAMDIDVAYKMLKSFNTGKKKQRKNREPRYMFDLTHHIERKGDSPDKRWYKFVNPDLWFTIAALDGEEAVEPDIPSLEDMFKVKTTVDRVQLYKATRIAGRMSDRVTIQADVDEKTLELKAGDGNARMCADLTPKNPALFEILDGSFHDNLVVSCFSIDYFKPMVKYLKSDTVMLKLGTEVPLHIGFDEFEDEPNPVHGQMLLAPRIENE